MTTEHGSRLDSTDLAMLRRAIELSRSSPRSASAFAVGAVVTAPDGTVLATGYSREGGDDQVHAEEAALAKVPATDLVGATVYSSLEPCSKRASRPTSCTQLIVASGARRVVFAWREPTVFVDRHGADDFAVAGLEVVEVPELAPAVREVNAHLLGSPEVDALRDPRRDRHDAEQHESR